MHQVRRQLVIGHQAPLDAIRIAESGDQQRFQFVAGQRLSMIVGDRLNLAAAHADCRGVFGMVGLRPWTHRDGLPVFAIGAQRRFFCGIIARVACLAQLIREKFDPKFLPGRTSRGAA